MRIKILIIICYIYLSSLKNITNGVYNFIFDNTYLSHNKRKISQSNTFNQNTFFRITNKLSDKNVFYNIEEIFSNYKLSFAENKELIFENEVNKLQFWSLIKREDISFSIKNYYNNCYIKVDEFKYYCDNITLNSSTKFKLIKIYTEVIEKNNNIDKEIMNNEPIDVLIKYIDLRDPNLTRKGIHQIEKDYDNEELRYSVRSILNYIPWIRKIFILMPNEKVRYFKD